MTSIAYVITLDPKCIYTQLARISIAAARRLHPEFEITVVCDSHHADTTDAAARALQNEVDTYLPLEVGFDTAVDRSRYLKTKLRNILDGDFLFIDCDAVPVSTLDPLVNSQGDVCMALDLNLSPDKYKLNKHVSQLYDFLGWKWPEKYFNSGVMLWRDNTDTRSLAENWHELWLQTRNQGCHKDQPSLNSAIDKLDFGVTVLPPKYNAMVEREAWGRCRPTILHFLKWKADDETILSDLFCELQRNDSVSQALLDNLLSKGYPWKNENSVSRQIACGRFSAALRCLLSRIVPSRSS